MAFVEELSGGGEIVGAVENVVVEGVADGVEIDLDVGKEIDEGGLGLERFFEIVNFMAEGGDAVFQVTLDVGWDGNAFGRGSDILAGGQVFGGGEGNG
jgi:hypothetical protein